MKRALPILLALSCLLVGYFIGKQSWAPTVAPSPSATEVDSKSDSEPALHLEPEQIKIAGVTTEPAHVETVRSGFQATGTLVAPPTHLVHVNSQAGGVVESIHVQVGDRVQSGALLAGLRSQEVVQAQSEYHQATVELQLARDSLANTRRLLKLDDLTNRPVEQARQEVSSAQSQLAGFRAQELAKHNSLERLQKLLEIGIASQQQVDQARADFESAKASRIQAEQDLAVAQQYLVRQKQIKSEGLKSSTELVPAESRVTAAEERLRVAQSKLEVFGAGIGREGEVVVRAPASGVVQNQLVARGENIVANQPLFQILDPRLLWLWVSVYESDLPKISLNQKARLTVAAYPARSFDGIVSYIEPSLDQGNRTTRARVKIQNPDGLLSPGMLATVEMLTDQGSQFVVVPKEAVVRISDQDFVYLQKGSDAFERVLVATKPGGDGRLAVTKGLSPGDKVVVKGSYYLKSEELKNSLGDDD